MATYTPTAVALAGAITLPADGENVDAIDVNAPIQALADGLIYATTHSSVRFDDLTAASGTWTVPTNVTYVELESWGGGGGGGGAAGGTTTTPTTRAGGSGGGGGGARKTITRMAVTPGAVIPYTVGAGGAGGASTPGDTSGNAGSDGADSTFNSVIVGRGAAGGNGGAIFTTTANQRPFVPGGRSVRGTFVPDGAIGYVTNSGGRIPSEPQSGGSGGFTSTVGVIPYDGGSSAEGFAGGAAGAQAGAVTNLAGNGGGGGGAGPGGVGAAGGLSGNGATGTGGPGSPGLSGAANSGAGAGGGGSGGNGGTAAGVGGAGGTGGSGKIRVIYFSSTAAVFT